MGANTLLEHAWRTTPLKNVLSCAQQRPFGSPVKVSRQRDKPSDILSHTGPECKRPLNVDIPLAVTNDKDLLGSRHRGEPLNVVGDILGGHLRICKTSVGNCDPCDIVSRSTCQRNTTVCASTSDLPFVGQDSIVWSRTPRFICGTAGPMNQEDNPSRPVLETVGKANDALELAARKRVGGISRSTATSGSFR